MLLEPGMLWAGPATSDRVRFAQGGDHRNASGMDTMTNMRRSSGKAGNLPLDLFGALAAPESAPELPTALGVPARTATTVGADTRQGRCSTCTTTLLVAWPSVAVITAITERWSRTTAPPVT
jgi:hypothetical protein